MTSTNESNNEFESWDELTEIWQGKLPDGFKEHNRKKKWSDYLENIRRMERREMSELMLDIVIGFSFIALGVATAISFFDFYPLVPDREFLSSGRNWLTGKPESSDFILTLYLISYITIFGFIALGVFISVRAYWLRKIQWEQTILSFAHAGEWFMRFFDNKIKLCRLSKQVAICLAIILWSAFIIARILTERPINFSDLHLLVARIGLLVILPLSIYLVAQWQEKKFSNRRQKIQKHLEWDEA